MTNSIRWGLTTMSALALMVGGVAFYGCSSSSNPAPAGNDTGTGDDSATDSAADTEQDSASEAATETGSDASDAADTAEAPPPGPAHLRIAAFMADAPAFDLCIVPSSAADFTGATPKGQAVGGFTYKMVTNYNDVPPGDYKVRVVQGGATSCATGLADLTITGLTHDAYYTYQAIGEFAKLSTPTDPLAPKFMLLTDMSTKPTGAVDANTRIFHAIPGGPAVDIGTTDATNTSLQIVEWVNLTYGTAHPASFKTLPPIAGTDYVDIALPSPETLGAAATGTKTPLLAKAKATWTAPAILNVWVLPPAAAGGSPVVFACEDSKTIGSSSPLSTCADVPAP